MLSIAEKLDLVNDYIESSEPPIHMVPLAEKLGINVYKAPWPNSVSGKIQKDQERGGLSGYAIFVNGDHSEQRRRFTIAHEISHYVLHEDRIGDGLFDDALYRSGLSNAEEQDANALAADLLMPRRLLREFEFSDVETLAHIFNVSEQSMAIRLGLSTAW